MQAGGGGGGDPSVRTAGRCVRAGGRADRLEATQTPRGKGGEGPVGARLTLMTSLRFEPEGKPRGPAGVRYEAYCGAETVGKFYRRHPGSERLATTGLANDLRRKRCKAGPPPEPRNSGEGELAPAGRGGERHDRRRVPLADRGAIIRRVNSASSLLAGTGFAMTHVGALSLGGSWGHEATIFVFVDDCIVRLRAAGMAGTADTWWIWTEDCDGLRRFVREVRNRVTRAPPMSPAGWQ